jgi:hypothetical protein
VAAAERWKLKTDGEEEEYDPTDPEHKAKLQRYAQLGRAGHKRLEEAAKIRKEAEGVLQALERDPLGTLERLGLDVDGLAESRLRARLEREQMTPEQRREAEERQRHETERQKFEREKAEWETQRAEALKAHYGQQLEKTLMDAVQAGGFPATPPVVARLAQLHRANLLGGIELSPDELAAHLRDDLAAETASILHGLDAPRLLALLGKETADKIRKHDVEQLRKKPAAPQAQPKPTPRPEPKPEQMREVDWDAYMRRVKAGEL